MDGRGFKAFALTQIEKCVEPVNGRSCMRLSRKQMHVFLRAFFALFLAGFSVQSSLFLGYHGSGRPFQPQPELGRVHPSNNHGSVIFLTDEEATGLSLLTVVCFTGLFPAGFFLWKLYGFGRTQRTVEDSATWRQNAVFPGALVFFLLIIFFLGPYAVDLAVSHGWVLRLLSGPWLLTRDVTLALDLS